MRVGKSLLSAVCGGHGLEVCSVMRSVGMMPSRVSCPGSPRRSPSRRRVGWKRQVVRLVGIAGTWLEWGGAMSAAALLPCSLGGRL